MTTRYCLQLYFSAASTVQHLKHKIDQFILILWRTVLIVDTIYLVVTLLSLLLKDKEGSPPHFLIQFFY